MNYITTYLRKIISRGYYSTIRLCGWIVLFCAGIRVIFYTDYHSVDEDLTAISVCSGHRSFNTYAGVAYRSVNDHPASASDDVAYKIKKINPAPLSRGTRF